MRLPAPKFGRDRVFKRLRWLEDATTGILGCACISTGEQDVTCQTMRLTQAGAIKVFTDVRSGRSMDRPGLQELIAYARHGDPLAVVRLDRLRRSLGELLITVAMLKERGIARLSLEEKIDTSSAAGDLVFRVFGAIAHVERRLIAERTKDGIAAAAPRQAARPTNRADTSAEKTRLCIAAVQLGSQLNLRSPPGQSKLPTATCPEPTQPYARLESHLETPPVSIMVGIECAAPEVFGSGFAVDECSLQMLSVLHHPDIAG